MTLVAANPPASSECELLASSSNSTTLVFRTKSPYEMLVGNYRVHVTVNDQARPLARAPRRSAARTLT